MHHGYLEKKITQAVESDSPPPKKLLFDFVFFFFVFLLGCLPYRMLTNTRTFSSSLYSPAAPPIRIMKQQQMRRRDDNRHWGESLECGGANWQI